MGDLFAVVVAVALLPEESLDLLHGVLPRGVQLEKLPHHRGLLIINDQPATVLAVAENAAVAQYHTFLDGLSVAELYPAGKLAQFVLGDSGHDGQA